MTPLEQIVVAEAVVILLQLWLWLWLFGKVGKRQRRVEERLDALEKTANDQQPIHGFSQLVIGYWLFAVLEGLIMRTLNWLTQRAKWLVPGGVAFCAVVLLLDLAAFWVLDRRPLMSSLEMTTVVWSLLIASGFTYAAKWSISGDNRIRIPLAATLLVMVALSAMHPWHNGWAKDAAAPVLPGDRDLPEVVVFEPGVLTEGEHAAY